MQQKNKTEIYAKKFEVLCKNKAYIKIIIELLASAWIIKAAIQALGPNKNNFLII